MCARTATLTFTYVAHTSPYAPACLSRSARVYVFVQQSEIHQPTSQQTYTHARTHTHTRTHVRGQRALSTVYAGAVSHPHEHIYSSVFTHCYAFARTHSQQHDTHNVGLEDKERVEKYVNGRTVRRMQLTLGSHVGCVVLLFSCVNTLTLVLFYQICCRSFSLSHYLFVWLLLLFSSCLFD